MLGPLLVIGLGALLYAAARRVAGAGGNRVVGIVMAAYGARLLLSLFLREVPLFSHGVGGDYIAYEQEARTIARLWAYDHVHYVTNDEFPVMARATLPPNLFALVTYVNDGESRLGCTSIIACLACLTCLNIFSLALDSGASPRTSLRVLATLLFLPSFLFYTSDMYKDGIVQFCVVGVGAAALRLSRRFSIGHLAFALFCLTALWGTRFYLTYAVAVPLGLGLLGLRSASPWRTFASIAIVCFAVLTLVGLRRGADTDALVDDARATYEVGTSREVRSAGLQGGSGVQLEGSPSTVFPQALFYTLFAPFLWQGGSIGLQLAKIDALVWYAIAFLAARAVVRLSKTNRAELLILLSFIVPTTLAYAAAFSNVGLTVRERLGVVMMCALLGAMGTSTQRAEDPADASLRPAAVRARVRG